MAIDNGEKIHREGLTVEAIAMYNLPGSADARHPKGRGNGYVLTVAGTRIHISGDTEDITEMRALDNIDYAFVCMNPPSTMPVSQTVDPVLEFIPKVVYPFHYRGGGGKFSDVEAFKKPVNDDDASIEVRLRDCYAEK